MHDQNHEEMVTYQFQIERDEWEAWKRTIPRRKSLEKRLNELIREDMERDTDD